MVLVEGRRLAGEVEEVAELDGLSYTAHRSMYLRYISSVGIFYRQNAEWLNVQGICRAVHRLSNHFEIPFYTHGISLGPKLGISYDGFETLVSFSSPFAKRCETLFYTDLTPSIVFPVLW